MYNPVLEGYSAFAEKYHAPALAQTYDAAPICQCVEQCIQ